VVKLDRFYCIYMYILNFFFRTFVKKYVSLKSANNKGHFTFVISRRIILRMRNVADRFVEKNKNTYGRVRQATDDM